MVELIVVVVIIAILGTIAFISIVNYPKQARDSKRISDLRLMEKSLSLYELSVGSYPMPEEIKTISSIYGAIEGTFGNDNFLQVGKLDQLPKDPLSDKTYTYFVSDNGKSFRIETKLEDGSIFSVGNLNPDNLLGTSLTGVLSTGRTLPCVPTEESFFTFDEDSHTIVDYNVNGPKDICLPDEINGIKVTNILATAFIGKQLTSVNIPNSIMNLGFYDINLYIKYNLSRGEGLFGAFSNNRLTSVILSEGLTEIGSKVFANNQLTNITIPDTVTIIGREAFSKNQLTDISFPNSVTTIKDGAFANNMLTNINLPNSIKTIGNYAFNNNQLDDNQAFIYARNSDGSENKTTLVSYGGAKRENVIIPSSVIYIWSYALHDLYLRSVIIPNSVSYIGYFAFINNSLTSVHIPNPNAKCDDGRDGTDWSECFDSEVEINHNQ